MLMFTQVFIHFKLPLSFTLSAFKSNAAGILLAAENIENKIDGFRSLFLRAKNKFEPKVGHLIGRIVGRSRYRGEKPQPVTIPEKKIQFGKKI